MFYSCNLLSTKAYILIIGKNGRSGIQIISLKGGLRPLLGDTVAKFSASAKDLAPKPENDPPVWEYYRGLS